MLSIQGGNNMSGGGGRRISKGTAELHIISIPSISRAASGFIYDT